MKHQSTDLSVFEAATPAPVPGHLGYGELGEYLLESYGTNAVRTDNLLKYLAQVLNRPTDQVKNLLAQDKSEALKINALFAQLSAEKSKWHHLVSTAYQAQSAGGALKNAHASISNFPGGDTTLPSKIQNDHLVNLFLKSLWMGFPDELKERYPHFRFNTDAVANLTHPCDFIISMLNAGGDIENCVSLVEQGDARHKRTDILPHLLMGEHVNTVRRWMDSQIAQAREAAISDVQEPVRAALIKHAVLNMGMNELDGISEMENDIRLQIPAGLSAIFNIDRAADILPAVSCDLNVDIAQLPEDLLEFAEFLAQTYIRIRCPRVARNTDEFSAWHSDPIAIGVQAVLIAHDFLSGAKLPRQVRGETNALVKAYPGMHDHFMKWKSDPAHRHTLLQSHWKYYLNRYAAVRYGYTVGYEADTGIDSYFAARHDKRALQSEFYKACQHLNSSTIVQLLRLIKPARLQSQLYPSYAWRNTPSHHTTHFGPANMRT